MSQPLLRVSGVTKSFGGTRALRGVDLEVAPGEIHALVGGNGSGKSTLLKILAGVYQADAGHLSVANQQWDLRNFDATDSRTCGLHFVHQQPTVFPSLTVMDNLCLGASFDTGLAGRIRWGSTRRRVADVLERFGIDASPETLVGNLSPAARTMVEVARTMQHQESAGPRSLLALDEPTAALPHREVDLLLPMLRRYASEASQAILFVTHRLEEVLEIADRVTVLRDGDNAGVLSTHGLTKQSLTEAIIGRPLDAYFPQPVVVERNRPAVLRAQGISGGGLSNVTFEVAAGEIVGLAGSMGSGRTSLLELLYGAAPYSTGTVLLDDKPLRLRGPHDAIHAGIGYVPEDRVHHGLLPRLSVADNLAVVDPTEYWRGHQSTSAERAAGNRAIDEFSIRASSAAAPMVSLSGGNQQKVVLARWLSRNTRVLLLDEPTQAVDVGARAEIWRLIRRAAAGGAAVVVASSDLEELAHLCSRVLVLGGGTVARELMGNPEVSVDELTRALIDLEAA